MKKIIFFILIALISLFKLVITEDNGINFHLDNYDCHKYGNSWYLINEDDYEVVEHSSRIVLKYDISKDISTSDFELRYELIGVDADIFLNKTSDYSFDVIIESNDIGKIELKIECILSLTNKTKITLCDKIYVYACYDYDFLSKASIFDAMFYRYVFLSNDTTPTFEEYDFFTNSSDSNYSMPKKHELSFSEKMSKASIENINVSGRITWFDEAGVEHPARNVTIEFYDNHILGVENILVNTKTNSFGDYSAFFENAWFLENGKNAIKMRILSQDDDITVVNNWNCIYKMSYPEDIFLNNTSSLMIDFQIGSNQSMNDVDQEIVGAFRVHQALTYGAEYASMKGDRLENINVVFPTTKSTSCFTNNKIHILLDDRNDWDVMLHEYGHYVADHYGISRSEGGDHFLGTCLNMIHGKQRGMALAWSEGWATYFSISSQLELNCWELNIANVGDLNYTDTVDANIDYSIENPRYDEYRFGESNEIAISAVLLDLADNLDDDNMEYGYTYIWHLIMANKCKDLSEFIQTIYIDSSDFEKTEIGNVLSSLDVAPNLISPLNDYVCDWNVQTFKWSSNGGERNTSKDYSNNLFSLVFYDKNKRMVYETNQTIEDEYILSTEEWTEVLSKSNEFIYWAVKAYQTTDSITGCYYSNAVKLYLPTSQNIGLDYEMFGKIDSGKADWYVFKAPMTGTYIFETSGYCDTYGELFSNFCANNCDINRLNEAFNDDGGEGNNFKIEYDLEVGQIVYLRVRGFNYNAVEDYSLLIICSHHTHDFQYKAVDSEYHILKCHCGATNGGYHRHVIGSGNRHGVIGNGRFRPCAYCQYPIDTWGKGMFPLLNVNETKLNDTENQVTNMLNYRDNYYIRNVEQDFFYLKTNNTLSSIKSYENPTDKESSIYIPVIGMGGITNAYDVIEMLYAGASLVQIGAHNLVDPYACEKIINDLPRVMAEYGIENLEDIIGRCE